MLNGGNPGNGEAGVPIVLTPRGAAILMNVLSATFLQRVTTQDDLDALVADLSGYWSFAHEQFRQQEGLSNARDARALHLLLSHLVDHLRGSFDLRENRRSTDS